jgi:hypothetical protein
MHYGTAGTIWQVSARRWAGDWLSRANLPKRITEIMRTPKLMAVLAHPDACKRLTGLCPALCGLTDLLSTSLHRLARPCGVYTDATSPGRGFIYQNFDKERENAGVLLGRRHRNWVHLEVRGVVISPTRTYDPPRSLVRLSKLPPRSKVTELRR